MPKGNVKGGKKHKRNKNYASENKSLRLKKKVKNMRKLLDVKVIVVLM